MRRRTDVTTSDEQVKKVEDVVYDLSLRGLLPKPKGQAAQVKKEESSTSATASASEMETGN